MLVTMSITLDKKREIRACSIKWGRSSWSSSNILTLWHLIIWLIIPWMSWKLWTALKRFIG
jgi:hypothetical protein